MTGDGRFLTFFVNDERESGDIPDSDPGEVHHLAFRIDGERIEEIAEALEDAGYPVSEFDRGAFHSLYTADNNGLGIEFVAGEFAVPDARRGEMFALARQFRMEDGSEFVQGEHVREAIRQFGLDIEETDVGDAATGRDV